MAFWLVKSEPNVWSWEQQCSVPFEKWDGVRNAQAAKNLRSMRLGDRAFFYHSNIGKEIVGIVEVVREHYPDPSDRTGRFCMVDFRAVEPLENPVSLARIKSEQALSGMALVRQSRLSVAPVSEREWAEILEISRKINP